MSTCMYRILSLNAAAWLGMQLLGCAQTDIVLGTGTHPAVDFPVGPSAPLTVTSEAAGAAAAQSPPSFAANGFVPPPPPAASESMPGPGSPASTAPRSRPSMRDADAGPSVANQRGSSGCGKEPLQPGATVDGQPANYLLDVPTGYDRARPYPLVLAFRSMDATAESFRAQLSLGPSADAIIAYPNPLDLSWQPPRDVALADELLSQLTQSYCVDMDRIFAMGDGSGALFTNLLGCVRGDQLRAIAMLSSAPPPPGPCVGETAVWMLQRSDGDPMMVGSGYANRDFWTRSNACDPRMPRPMPPAPCVDFRGCSPGLPVHFCEYRGTQWPSYAVGDAWDFFDSF